MADCPFLSTEDDKIQCFDECAFYKWEENQGVCPFKHLASRKIYKIRSYGYELIENDEEIISFKNYYREQY